MGKIINLEGQRFGRLTIIKDTGKKKWRKVIWLCQCDCGNLTKVQSNSLRTKNTKSCGCRTGRKNLYKEKDWLNKKYKTEELSLAKIGKICGVSIQTILNHMKKFGIKRRNLKEALLSNTKHLSSIDNSCRNKKWLYQKYWGEKLSLTQIANLCRADSSIIHYWMKKHRIKARTLSEAQNIIDKPYNHRSWLRKKYCKDKLTASEIAKICAVKTFNIFHALKKYGIKTRSKSEVQKGEKNSRWLGGISFEPYGIEFNKDLREKIRKRDNYTCQMLECGAVQNGRKFHVHHIDYQKINNEDWNLITLCLPCHMKTNTNREYWENYFTTYICEK